MAEVLELENDELEKQHIDVFAQNLTPEEQEQNALIIFKDLVAGTYAGLILTVTGFPLDTIKTRMQIYNDSLKNTIIRIFFKEKIKSFFNGMAFPFYSVPLVNACVFGAFEFFKRIMVHYGCNDAYKQGVYSGLFAGFVNTFVVSPIELVKCRLQVQLDSQSANARYRGSMDCVREIMRTEGIKGLYRGTIATMLREIPAYGGQFWGYEVSKEYFTKKYGEFGYIHKLLAGGFAGICCWVWSYPQDVIKTRLQVMYTTPTPGNSQQGLYGNYNKFIRDGGFVQCAKEIYKQNGFKGYWQGFSACLIRAFYANACCFVAYEQAREYLFKPRRLANLG